MEAQELERQQREKDQPGSHLTSPDAPPRPDINKTKTRGHHRQDSDGSLGRGWKPEGETTTASKIADPMLQQMEIIRGYIRQAKQAKKFDEVAMLEQNLRDLQLEFTRQRQGSDES